jgi:hypothetical protein
VPQWGSLRASSMILLAEAMILLQDEFDPLALDRLNRGFAISNAAGARDIATAFASWLAHFNFNRSHFSEMRKWLSYCDDYSDQLTDSAASRVYLTMADATRYAGDFVGSDDWYSRSRQFAVRIGDEAFLAANMYNRAAYGIARLRLNWTRADFDTKLLSQSKLEIESAINYSRATGNRAAEHLQLLWLARVTQLNGDHSDALPMLELALSKLPEAKHSRLRTSILVDIAFSKRALGASFEDSGLGEIAKRVDAIEIDPDDKVVCLSQLVHSAALISHTEASNIASQLARALSDHTKTTTELGTQLSGLQFKLA